MDFSGGTGAGHGLETVCSRLGYRFQRHDAIADARAIGFVLSEAIKASQVGLSDWFRKVNQPIGGPIARAGAPDGPMAGEIVVFTGALSIRRREAAEFASSAGCTVVAGVSKRVTILVVGDQDVTRLVPGNSKSTKHRKAEQLVARGAGIRILRESDFLELVSLAD